MIIHAAVPEVGWRSQFEALPCAVCRHFVARHQTGHGAYTGWCEESECKCEWPMIDTVEQVAVERDIPLARLQELVAANRDEDGWPVGPDGHPVGPLTEAEHWAVQELDTLEQAAQEQEDRAVDHGVSYLD